MHLGRALGYSILAFVDALVPTVVAIFVVGFTLVGYTISGLSGVTIALLAGVVTFVGTLAGSAVSHYRGGSPFAFTRLAKTAFHLFWYWPPWVGWHRRRNR
jgi:hypothetical protein